MLGINGNGEYVIVEDEEFETVETSESEITGGADKLETLAEGLSTATSLAAVRAAAKSVIESGD